jgi:hypothetical protein
MKCFMPKRCTHLCYFLLFIFLVAMSGCSTKHAWFKPDKDDLGRKQDVLSCEEKAAKFSRNMGKAGNKDIVDQHMKECMEALDYKWVPEDSIPNLKEKQTDLMLMGGAPANVTETFPYCTEAEADWCGPCWNNPVNTWCCKQRGGTSPNCGKDSSTCRYCDGCHKGNDCINICTKPPKGAGGSTNIKITNATDKDITIAFVTGASGGACKDLNKMISYQWVADNTTWCQKPTQDGGDANAGYCTGTVPARGFVEVKRTGENALKCLTGSILLDGKLSCPSPNGFTQGEFTLNPTDTDTEAIDISLVNGVNYALAVNLPGKAWKVQDGGANVTSIGPNEGINGNNNKNGIFPPGCTDCILAVKDRIPCPKLTPNPKCQQTRICNIYRGGWTGGTVEYVISNVPK